MGLLYLLVIGTSIWMAIESSSFGYKKEDIKGLAAMGPAGWFFAGLFLWIVAFPVYLASRAELKAAGAKNNGSTPASRILYAEAYKLHHTDRDLSGALALYKKIVTEQQGTPEALNAHSQIASIASGSSAPPLVNAQAVATAQPTASARCTRCGGNARHVAEHAQYWCDACSLYVVPPPSSAA